MSPKPAEVYISYRRRPDLKFDVDYYLNTHLPLVVKHWGPHGLLEWTVVQFVPNDPSGVHVQVNLRFESLEAADRALGEYMTPELRGDLPNYSNYPPDVTKAGVLGHVKL